jgi:hypothetical protein
MQKEMRKHSVEGGKLIGHCTSDLYLGLVLGGMRARSLVALGFSLSNRRDDIPTSTLEKTIRKATALKNSLQ